MVGEVTAQCLIETLVARLVRGEFNRVHCFVRQSLVRKTSRVLLAMDCCVAVNFARFSGMLLTGLTTRMMTMILCTTASGVEAIIAMVV